MMIQAPSNAFVTPTIRRTTAVARAPTPLMERAGAPAALPQTPPVQDHPGL
jgi:hypothetical protein